MVIIKSLKIGQHVSMNLYAGNKIDNRVKIFLKNLKTCSNSKKKNISVGYS